MRKIIKKSLVIILEVLAIASIFFIVYYIQRKIESENQVDILATTISETNITKDNESENQAPVAPANQPPEEKLPSKFLLSVPFQPQAPYGDWSEPYENGCEEAAIVIVKYYLEDKSLSKEAMKKEIDDSVAWQIGSWGGHDDLSADTTLKLAYDYFGYSGKVVRNYSLEDLKKIIHSGKPIIAPTAGRRLGNPNFRGAGPEYHMIVIIGWDDEKGIFITNDPGTRKGKSYIYKYQTVLSAVSGPKENMEKAVVVLEK